MLDPKIVSLVIFVLSYLCFIFFPIYRTHIALLGAFLLIVTGTVLPIDAFYSISWNVMGMFVGMLIIADIFMQSRVPAYFAEVIVNKTKKTVWAILFICVLTSFISAFVENVATVLIVAPIALSLARKLVEKLPQGYFTKFGNHTIGEELLKPTKIYAKCVLEMLTKGVNIHYMSNISGSAFRKISRAKKDFIYIIEKLPAVPSILKYLQKIENILQIYGQDIESERKEKLQDFLITLKQLKNTTNIDKLRIIAESVLIKI